MTPCGQGAYHVFEQTRSGGHMSGLIELKQELLLETAKVRAQIQCWMLAQTLTLIGAMAALKLFG
ncbi:hypothetical protein ASE26_07900 [Duganella sp. Root198D2]|nr:hypothetical protein ASE26_07900 [Duganella sp. Root198D2]